MDGLEDCAACLVVSMISYASELDNCLISIEFEFEFEFSVCGARGRSLDDEKLNDEDWLPANQKTKRRTEFLKI